MQHTFPPISPFLELIQWEERTPNTIILRDHSSGMTATAGQLLHSVSLLRAKLQATLVQDFIHDAGNNSEDRFIFLLAPPGLEYVVSMLTIFSVGAGMSAQCKPLLSVGQIHHAYSKSSNHY
jgi:malonyl-CoA/methylmalonyl-CoA synthetase